MAKAWLAAAAIATALTGAAAAQTTTYQSTTTTLGPAPLPPPAVAAPEPPLGATTRVERSVDPYGTETVTRQWIEPSGGGNVLTTRTDVRGVDGSLRSTYRQEVTPLPLPPPLPVPNSVTTTTTTVR